MVVRKGRPVAKPAARAAKSASVRKPAPAKRAPAKRAPVKKAPDVTMYADKEPTGYHKAFAKWIVTEVGFDPNDATSKRAAFLMGVSIATAARPAFQNSDFLAEWRESTGEAKRGPKPKSAPADEVEEDDSDFEDEDEEDEDFEDEESEEDDDESDDEDEDDDDFEDEEEEPEPPKKPVRRAAAKKPAARGRRPVASDDDDLF
jgi:hypothetical protein